MEKIFDKYVWQARVLPALLTLLPLGLAFAAWVGKPEDVAKPVLGLVVGAGVVVLLAQISREAGKKLELAILKERGRKPSIYLLRHRDTMVDSVTKKRYHTKLQAAIPGISMPTAEEEASNPEAADEVYASCVKYLVSKRSDHKAFPVLWADNIDYGFRRNLCGLKNVGLTLAVLGLLGSTGKLIYDYKQGQDLSMLAALCSAACLLATLMWVAFVKKDWVWNASISYGLRLLDSIEQLEAPAVVAPPTSTQTGT